MSPETVNIDLPRRSAWDAHRQTCRRLIGCAFLLFFLVYRVSPMWQIYDSQYSMLLSESLYRHGTFDLARYVNHAEPAAQSSAAALPYQLARVGDHVYYKYPPGTSVLSIPPVMILNALGLSAIGPDGRWSDKGEGRVQKWIAPAVAAATATLLLLLALMWLPMGQALGVAAMLGLGTSLWSTASRGMWSQTWQVFLLSAALLLVARPAWRGRLSWRGAALLGSGLAWMYFVRPTSAISIAGLTIYLLLRDWRSGVIVGAVGLLWLAAFCAWSEALYGMWRPPYYQSSDLGLSNALAAGLGQLASPSRGLLVYSPWLLVPLALLFWRWRRLPRKGLAAVALGVIVAHWVLISLWTMWWFGHCYGPRAFLDMVPWFGLLAILALASPAKSADGGQSVAVRWSGIVLAAVLMASSVLLHGIGAFSGAASRWNQRPGNVDLTPSRFWDWKDAQFLRAFKVENRTTRRPGG